MPLLFNLNYFNTYSFSLLGGGTDTRNGSEDHSSHNNSHSESSSGLGSLAMGCGSTTSGGGGGGAGGSLNSSGNGGMMSHDGHRGTATSNLGGHEHSGALGRSVFFFSIDAYFIYY